MSTFTRYPLLRWLVPAGVTLAVIGGGAATRLVSASADPTLPNRTAAQLLVSLQQTNVSGLSGTVVERADLGLPAMPAVLTAASTDLMSLLSGSHTLRVWYSNPDRARVALLGKLGETDVIVNQRDMWVWESARSTATHHVIPDRPDGGRHQLVPSLAVANPQSLAEEALKAIEPSTVVTTAGTARVAGRAAYELVLAPKETGSLISQVRIAVDADRHVPLRVQVYARNSDTPGFECAFTDVTFKQPDAEQFRFNPPQGTRVIEPSSSPARPQQSGGAASPAPQTGAAPGGAVSPTYPLSVGTGWSTVLVFPAPRFLDLIGGKITDDSGIPQAEAEQLSTALGALPQVSGSWGKGWILSGKLFSVLLTADGRALIGAVDGQRLTTAAADPAAALKGTK